MTRDDKTTLHARTHVCTLRGTFLATRKRGTWADERGNKGKSRGRCEREREREREREKERERPRGNPKHPERAMLSRGNVRLAVK